MAEWLKGTRRDMVFRLTALLLDFVVVFVSSSLARYQIPAWQALVEARKVSLFNDISVAYRSVSEDLPYYFSDEHPFDQVAASWTKLASNGRGLPAPPRARPDNRSQPGTDGSSHRASEQVDVLILHAVVLTLPLGKVTSQ